MKTLLIVIQKEFRQFRRSAFLPRLVLMFPLVVMLVMPLVTNMDVKHVGVAVVDNDGQAFSRHLMERIEASSYLSVASLCHSYGEALTLIERGEADVILEIPQGFERGLALCRSNPATAAPPKKLNISANAVNGTKGSLGLQYVSSLVAGIDGSSARIKYLFNPTLDYRHFMIPALTIMLLVMISGFLPALGMVGEREHGTIEQINVTPISPMVFAVGKVVPYWIIGLAVLSIAMLVAWIVYGLSPGWGIGTVYLAAFLFIIVMSSLGVSIAARSDTMQQVMFVMFFFVVVFILMSGLMTPIASMPQWAQRLTLAIPPRYFVDIMRAVYLRRATMADLWPQFAALTVFAAAFLLVAMKSVRKRG